MRIEIWSDVVCPWCYIGKRRMETALAAFQQAHPDAEVDVHWRSYELDPSAPSVPTQTVAEHLGAKYGGGAAGGQQMIDRVEAVAAEEGMVWRHHDSLRVGTMDAHRLLHLAHHEGGSAMQGELKEALLSAYFVEARNVADHAVLREIAVGAGLDAGAVDRVLASDELADEVWADIEQAQRFGATGVPFFVVDEKYGVSGAQPADTFTQVLERAWAERTPAVQMVAGAGEQGDACGPDGCAVPAQP
jgi:predicted DsbA family dithiol-disulfide isomerase